MDRSLGECGLKHIALLAMPTLGFPASLRALTWIEDLANR